MDEEQKGVKFDEGKLRYDLLPTYAIEEIVRVFTNGANKYSPHNWQKGMEWSRLFSAMMRHCFKFWSGEDLDEETNLSHMAHAAWNALALLEYTKYFPEFDDRWAYKKKEEA